MPYSDALAFISEIDELSTDTSTLASSEISSIDSIVLNWYIERGPEGFQGVADASLPARFGCSRSTCVFCGSRLDPPEASLQPIGPAELLKTEGKLPQLYTPGGSFGGVEYLRSCSASACGAVHGCSQVWCRCCHSSTFRILWGAGGTTLGGETRVDGWQGSWRSSKSALRPQAPEARNATLLG